MYALKSINLPGAIDDAEMIVRKFSYNMSTKKFHKQESAKTPIKITVQPPVSQLQDVDNNTHIEKANRSNLAQNQTLSNKPTLSEKEPFVRPKVHVEANSGINLRGSFVELSTSKEKKEINDHHENFKNPQNVNFIVNESYKNTFNRGSSLSSSIRNNENDIQVHIEDPQIKPISAKPVVKSISYNAVAKDYIQLIYKDRKEFASTVPPKDQVFLCRITRDRSGFEKGMYPTYYLHLEKAGNKKEFLLAAKKISIGNTTNILISDDPIEIGKKGDHYVGKLKQGPISDGFTLYDNGESVKTVGIDAMNLRNELAGVYYETSFLGHRGPRKMAIAIPDIDIEGKPYEITPTSEKDGLLGRMKSRKFRNMLEFGNKMPVWNEKTKSYALNFHGRVTVSSVKNFQIIDPLSPNQVILQFGKIHDDTFTMDYCYPFTALQAFGIVLTCFEA